jgi:hypothetical protein
VGDTGSYDLPADYAYMTDQTGWQINTHWPLVGPLSPQDWALLKGRMITTATIASGFRLFQNKFELWPQPPVDGIVINMEYISRNWAVEQGDPNIPVSEITTGSNIVLYEPILIKKFLKVKWLDAKGFDSSAARLDFDTIYQSRTGKDTGAQILSAGGGRGGIPLLNMWTNVPNTGFGL